MESCTAGGCTRSCGRGGSTRGRGRGRGCGRAALRGGRIAFIRYAFIAFDFVTCEANAVATILVSILPSEKIAFRIYWALVVRLTTVWAL